MSIIVKNQKPFYAKSADFRELTTRDDEIKYYLVRGYRAKAIGIKLGITEGTVKIHTAKILRCFGSTSKLAFAMADENFVPVPVDEIPEAELTERQAEVLEHLSQGMTCTQIVLAIGIAAGTVKLHLAEVYRRLGLSNNFEYMPSILAARIWRTAKALNEVKTGAES